MCLSLSTWQGPAVRVHDASLYLSCALSTEWPNKTWSCFICLVSQIGNNAVYQQCSGLEAPPYLSGTHADAVTSVQLCNKMWNSLVLCVCRSGLVISIAEPDTLFVIKKMAKRLQVPIEKAAVSEGILALDDEAADLPAATAAQG